MRIVCRIVRQEIPVETYEGQDMRHPRRGIGDGEAVARLAGAGVKRNEGCNAGRVDALNGGEIEGDGLTLHQRQEAVQQAQIVAPYQFGGLGRFICRDHQGGGWLTHRDHHKNSLGRAVFVLRLSTV